MNDGSTDAPLMTRATSAAPNRYGPSDTATTMATTMSNSSGWSATSLPTLSTKSTASVGCVIAIPAPRTTSAGSSKNFHAASTASGTSHTAARPSAAAISGCVKRYPITENVENPSSKSANEDIASFAARDVSTISSASTGTMNPRARASRRRARERDDPSGIGAREDTLGSARARASPIDSSSSTTTTTRRWTIDAASRARAPRTSSRARRSSSSVRRRDVSTALGRALARRRSTVGVMVCTRCEKKMRAAGGAALVTTAPVRRRDLALGARDALDERRPVNENKALSAKRRGPYGAAIGRTKCAVCRTSLHTGGTHCNACAHAKGVCSQCGVKIMDTSAYNGHEDVEDGRSSKIEAASGVKDRRDVSTEDIERAEKREEEEEEEKAEASAEAAKEAAAPDAPGGTHERCGRREGDGTGGERWSSERMALR